MESTSFYWLNQFDLNGRMLVKTGRSDIIITCMFFFVNETQLLIRSLNVLFNFSKK